MQDQEHTASPQSYCCADRSSPAQQVQTWPPTSLPTPVTAMGRSAACRAAGSASCSCRPSRKPPRSWLLSVSFCSSSRLQPGWQRGSRSDEPGRCRWPGRRPRRPGSKRNSWRQAGRGECRRLQTSRCMQGSTHRRRRGSSASNSNPSRPSHSWQPPWDSCATAGRSQGTAALRGGDVGHAWQLNTLTMAAESVHPSAFRTHMHFQHPPARQTRRRGHPSGVAWRQLPLAAARHASQRRRLAPPRSPSAWRDLWCHALVPEPPLGAQQAGRAALKSKANERWGQRVRDGNQDSHVPLQARSVAPRGSWGSLAFAHCVACVLSGGACPKPCRSGLASLRHCCEHRSRRTELASRAHLPRPSHPPCSSSARDNRPACLWQQP